MQISHRYISTLHKPQLVLKKDDIIFFDEFAGSPRRC